MTDWVVLNRTVNGRQHPGAYRVGAWLFNVDTPFRLTPSLCLWHKRGWSLWWLTFELARVSA